RQLRDDRHARGRARAGTEGRRKNSRAVTGRGGSGSPQRGDSPLVGQEMLAEKHLNHTAVNPVDFGQARDSLLLEPCLRAEQRLVRMLRENPEAELAPDVRLTYAFDDLD